MADSGIVRLLFLSANLIFWLVGGGLLGFVGWTLSSLPNTSGFMSGSFLILYAGIAIGVLISLDGLIGCLGGLIGSMMLLKIYLGLSVVFGVVELMLIMAVYVEKDQIPSLLESTWDEINEDARFTIQKSLKCCGIESYTEYGTDYVEFPDSCFRMSQIFGTVMVKQESTLYSTSCLSAMQTWLKDNTAIWIAVLIGITLIQILSGMLSCQVFTRLHENVRVNPLNNEEDYDVEKDLKNEPNDTDDMHDLEAISGDRNIDGASHNSNSSFESDDDKDANVGMLALVSLDDQKINEDNLDEKSMNEKQFAFKSEPRLNEADLDNTLNMNENHFKRDEDILSDLGIDNEKRTDETNNHNVDNREITSPDVGIVTEKGEDDSDDQKNDDNELNSSNVRTDSEKDKDESGDHKDEGCEPNASDVETNDKKSKDASDYRKEEGQKNDLSEFETKNENGKDHNDDHHIEGHELNSSDVETDKEKGEDDDHKEEGKTMNFSDVGNDNEKDKDDNNQQGEDMNSEKNEKHELNGICDKVYTTSEQIIINSRSQTSI